MMKLAQKVELITDNLSSLLDRAARQDIVSNFKKIESAINGLSVDDSDDTVSKDDLNKQVSLIKELVANAQDALTTRINRIVLGTDQETIKLVVRQILKDEGVI